MVKGMFVVFLSLLLLSACSQQQKAASLAEAIGLEGIGITELHKITDISKLDGITPVRYILDNTLETIMVYDFDTKEKRELGQKQFQERQQLLSSQAPIVYKAQNYLILYYSDVDSKTQTPKLAETEYGEKLQKAFKRIG
ncbi:hypothetical protein [Paenibacillus prosopidis]|uniref:Sporulation lipoprotein YhcN/YlaJ n=1 Tax=Paenibacillus prosopidis TaxID=630520 RepID=A0A368VGV1_9BACL|nr:hypothetical protein [Paenibacillus prosopidis]RCW40526.1 hypothetical protein DFP97_1342 [Paenibacillus prosopidis]